MKYTKKQRHEIYKNALKYHIETRMCICWSLDKVGKIGYDYGELGILIQHYMKKLFPEFGLFEPIEGDEAYWFDNNKQRETVLEFCIEMTR